jgi:hypothetical protein
VVWIKKPRLHWQAGLCFVSGTVKKGVLILPSVFQPVILSHLKQHRHSAKLCGDELSCHFEFPLVYFEI